MLNKKTEFEDILRHLDINIKEFKELDAEFFAAENFEPDILRDAGVSDDEINKLSKHYKEVKSKYIDLCIPISQYYYNKIYNEGWNLSTEDIARHLDLSINFVQTKLITKIDRIELPNSDYQTKRIIKMMMDNELYEQYAKHPNYPMIVVDYRNRLRKKVLYSQKSYIEYLKQNMILVDDNKVIKIHVPDRIVNLGKKKFSKYANVDDKVMVETLFKFFLNNNKSDLNKYKSNKYNFKGMLDARFNAVFYYNKDEKYCGDFKSKASLRVLFNKVYDIEVERILSGSQYDSVVFDLYISGKKLPSKRYLLNKDFLIENIKESIGIEEKKEDKKQEKEKLYKVTIPAHYFQKKFKANVSMVEKEFLNMVEMIVK